MEILVWLAVSKFVERPASCLQVSGKAISRNQAPMGLLVIRDRQFCHCGNVEPPTESKVGLEM